MQQQERIHWFKYRKHKWGNQLCVWEWMFVFSATAHPVPAISPPHAANRYKDKKNRWPCHSHIPLTEVCSRGSLHDDSSCGPSYSPTGYSTFVWLMWVAVTRLEFVHLKRNVWSYVSVNLSQREHAPLSPGETQGDDTTAAPTSTLPPWARRADTRTESFKGEAGSVWEELIMTPLLVHVFLHHEATELKRYCRKVITNWFFSISKPQH